MQEAKNIIAKYAKNNKNFFFIQIGAYDGITGDPIYKLARKYQWRGILVEPQKDQFKKLKRNYLNQIGLKFENLAIAKKNEIKIFYGVRATRYDNNSHGQLNSFNRNVILKHSHMVANLEKRITENKVRCLSYASLLKKHKVKKIDLLQIDTEGFDFEIIKQINFKKLRPKMIFFEYKHLSEKDKKKCKKILEQEGYKLITKRFNAFAF